MHFYKHTIDECLALCWLSWKAFMNSNAALALSKAEWSTSCYGSSMVYLYCLGASGSVYINHVDTYTSPIHHMKIPYGDLISRNLISLFSRIEQRPKILYARMAMRAQKWNREIYLTKTARTAIHEI